MWRTKFCAVCCVPAVTRLLFTASLVRPPCCQRGASLVNGRRRHSSAVVGGSRQGSSAGGRIFRADPTSGTAGMKRVCVLRRAVSGSQADVCVMGTAQFGSLLWQPKVW